MPVDSKFYRLLEISETATTEEVRRAYRKKALIHHPDKGGDKEMFQAIGRAYEVLSDPEKRKAYDALGENAQQHTFNPMDIFKTVFQGGFPFSFFQFPHQKKEKPTLSASLTVSLEDVCTRKAKTIKARRDSLCQCAIDAIASNSNIKCVSCGGSGIVSITSMLMPGMMSRSSAPCQTCNATGNLLPSCQKCSKGIFSEEFTKEIFLTPEMNHNYQYKFEKEGHEDLSGRGLFVVEILLAPHDVFKVEKYDLICSLDVPLKMALLGFSIKLYHPSGEIFPLEITEIISPTKNEKIIPGYGLNKSGVLILKFNLVFPEMLTDLQREEIKKIL